MSTGSDSKIDLEAVADFAAHASLDLEAPLRCEPLGGGRSNLTFVISDAAERRFVLRRPPLGPLLPTAHDVLREARILAALAPTDVPVPRILTTCTDAAVLGAPFFLMEFVPGLVVRNVDTAMGATPTCRSRAGSALVEALATLHDLAPRDVGLSDLAREGSYVERQLRRWSRQWEATTDRPVPAMDDLQRRLREAVPAQQRTSLVHGDPKLDNCVLDDLGDLQALLDWELSTVGDPLADLALTVAYWAEPPDDDTALQDPPTVYPGFATRRELIERYGRSSQLDLTPLPYYLAFSYWKVACIVQGVAHRLRASAPEQSNATTSRFDAQVQCLIRLAEAALAQRKGV